MARFENAMEQIKTLECPTGDVKNRIVEILQRYEVADPHEVTVKREDRFDEDGAEAYRVTVYNNIEQSMIILVKPGADDYVAKVVETYMT